MGAHQTAGRAPGSPFRTSLYWPAHIGEPTPMPSRKNSRPSIHEDVSMPSAGCHIAALRCCRRVGAASSDEPSPQEVFHVQHKVDAIDNRHHHALTPRRLGSGQRPGGDAHRPCRAPGGHVLRRADVGSVHHSGQRPRAPLCPAPARPGVFCRATRGGRRLPRDARHRLRRQGELRRLRPGRLPAHAGLRDPLARDGNHRRDTALQPA